MATSRVKYVVLAFNAWDSVQAQVPALMPVHPIGRSSGFMLVYDSLRDLRRDYPDSEYCAIKPAPAKKKPRKRGRIDPDAMLPGTGPIAW